MFDDPNKITYFAETDSRNKKVPFGIKSKDRSRHMYVIGKTGMGKSTLLENLAIQDIQSGEGICFIDPHGSSAEKLLDYVPEHRVKDVLYFAPFDMDYPISFNVMEDIGADKRHLVVNGLMSTFKKIWLDAWSARMEYFLTNAIYALLEYPGSTLLSVNRMFSEKSFRDDVISKITDVSVKSFWANEFASMTERFIAEAVPAIQNKVGQLSANPLIRNIIGQEKSSFDIRQLMDNSKIFIVNMSKGQVGEANANLLGSMLITKIYLAALSRAELSESNLMKMPDFYTYVDEFQSFANESFANILSEARKYKLALIIAHQYIEQMSEEVRAAVFGNVGSLVTFRVGSFDAEIFEKEFTPYFTAQDIVNLGPRQIYLRLMIDGIGSQPFSAATLPPIAKPSVSYRDEIIRSSREQFAKPRSVVEADIAKWIMPIEGAQSAPPKKDGAKKASSEMPSKDLLKEALLKVKGITPQASPKDGETPKNDTLGKVEPKKPTPVPVRNDNKGPKPENVNKLKDLISTIKINPEEKTEVPAQNENSELVDKDPILPQEKILEPVVQSQIQKENVIPENKLNEVQPPAASAEIEEIKEMTRHLKEATNELAKSMTVLSSVHKDFIQNRPTEKQSQSEPTVVIQSQPVEQFAQPPSAEPVKPITASFIYNRNKDAKEVSLSGLKGALASVLEAEEKGDIFPHKNQPLNTVPSQSLINQSQTPSVSSVPNGNKTNGSQEVSSDVVRQILTDQI